MICVAVASPATVDARDGRSSVRPSLDGDAQFRELTAERCSVGEEAAGNSERARDVDEDLDVVEVGDVVGGNAGALDCQLEDLAIRLSHFFVVRDDERMEPLEVWQ